MNFLTKMFSFFGSFYGLAVKTGSIALQKFFSFHKKVYFLRSKIIFPNPSQKPNGTFGPLFSNIFARF